MMINLKNKQKKEAEEEARRRSLGGFDDEAPPPAKPEAEEKPAPSSNPIVRLFEGIMALINSMAVQTLLYFAFVGIFQFLTSTMRVKEEFYLCARASPPTRAHARPHAPTRTCAHARRSPRAARSLRSDKHVMDRIVENHFDSSHNTFESIRRVADVYEWGNTVLWPGLFGDAGPCTGTPGSRVHPKTCVDEAWPDGDGSFHLEGAHHFGVTELVERMDMFDWTDGLVIKLGRVDASACPTTSQLGECYPELTPGNGGTSSFGFNWTHPSSPMAHPFAYTTADENGANPGGVQSASFASLRPFDTSGYVVAIIPFFSDTYLPNQEGTPAEVIDYKDSYVNTTNGRTPSYYCVRLSPTKNRVIQLCDPGSNGDGTGRPTGAVRAAVETLWNDLKRGHFIDHRARVMTITLQLRNNHVRLRRAAPPRMHACTVPLAPRASLLT